MTDLAAKYGIRGIGNREIAEAHAEIEASKFRDKKARAERERQQRQESLKAADALLETILRQIIETELAPRLGEANDFKVVDVARAVEDWRVQNERRYQMLRLERLNEAADHVRDRGAVEINYRGIALPADVVAEAAVKLRMEILAAAERAPAI